jgi:hypothetical protein
MHRRTVGDRDRRDLGIGHQVSSSRRRSLEQAQDTMDVVDIRQQEASDLTIEPTRNKLSSLFQGQRPLKRTETRTNANERKENRMSQSDRFTA